MRVHCSQSLESLDTADLKFTEQLCLSQAPGGRQTARRALSELKGFGWRAPV